VQSKGLQLIAQFSFQRAPGASTRKIFTVPETKNLSADFLLGCSDFQNRYALKIVFPTRTVNIFFEQSIVLKSVVNVAKSGIRARIFCFFVILFDRTRPRCVAAQESQVEQ
jgi:hypothetical protein